jgi:hypothetical protein
MPITTVVILSVIVACFCAEHSSSVTVVRSNGQAQATDTRNVSHTWTYKLSSSASAHLSEIFCSTGSQVSCSFCTKAKTSSGVMARE